MNKDTNNHSAVAKQKQLHLRQINFPLIVIGLSIFGLTIAAILSILTPPKETLLANDFVTNNYDQTKSTFKKVNFSGETIVVPKEFGIYQAQSNLGVADDLANKLIQEYQMVADDKIDNYWQSDQKSLAKNDYEQYYILNSATAEERNSVPILIQEAIDVCLNFYSKYELLLSLKVQKEDIIYSGGGFEAVEVEPQEAVLAKIPLTYELDGYQLYYQNHDDYPFFCQINNNYELEKVVFRDLFQNFQNTRRLPAIPLDQAIKNIGAGQASIIRAESRIASVIDLNWIDTADLYSVQLEYRYDEELRIAYPFYNFKAKLTNSAGINIEATIITPAVASAAKQKGAAK